MRRLAELCTRIRVADGVGGSNVSSHNETSYPPWQVILPPCPLPPLSGNLWRGKGFHIWPGSASDPSSAIAHLGLTLLSYEVKALGRWSLPPLSILFSLSKAARCLEINIVIQIMQFGKFASEKTTWSLLRDINLFFPLELLSDCSLRGQLSDSSPTLSQVMVCCGRHTEF